MIVTVAFGKGGTGKTTTAAALVNYARMKGKSVLAIDCDPQANFTYALGGDATKPGLFSVLTNQAQVTDVTQETPQTFLVSGRIKPCSGRTGDSKQTWTGLHPSGCAERRS